MEPPLGMPTRNVCACVRAYDRVYVCVYLFVVHRTLSRSYTILDSNVSYNYHEILPLDWSELSKVLGSDHRIL